MDKPIACIYYTPYDEIVPGEPTIIPFRGLLSRPTRTAAVPTAAFHGYNIVYANNILGTFRKLSCWELYTHSDPTWHDFFHKAETMMQSCLLPLNPTSIADIYGYCISSKRPIQIRCTIERTIGPAWQYLATLKSLVDYMYSCALKVKLALGLLVGGAREKPESEALKHCRRLRSRPRHE